MMARLQRWPIAVLILALASAAAMTLRIVQRGELWIDRTYWLVGMAALAGGLAGLFHRAVLVGRLARAGRVTRVSVASLCFAILFIGMLAVMIVGHSMLISGQFEPRSPLLSYRFLRGTAEFTGFAALSTMTYLLPWPLPALMALTGLLLPERARSEVEESRRSV